MASDILNTIRSLIADICAVERGAVLPASRLVGFGLDSVRLLDLILGIEEACGVTISESDPDLSGVQTVKDLVDLVERRVKG